MKKNILILTLFSLFVVGCSTNNTQSDDNSNEASTIISDGESEIISIIPSNEESEELNSYSEIDESEPISDDVSEEKNTHIELPPI